MPSSSTLPESSPTFINNNSELQQACQTLITQKFLIFDTEFIRTDTFYPIPALIQIYDGSDCYLIDPLLIDDFSPLKDILQAEHIIKVLHSCSEDLEIFDVLCQTLPKPLFDTQIAAAFLGHGFSVGYSRLVNDLLGIEIPKDATRSNWLQRPLTQIQIDYAALDVIHLYDLYVLFIKQFENTDKEAWLQTCNQVLLDQYPANQQPENYFSRCKNAWRLSPTQQSLFFKLVLWREQTARQKNKPRNHVINDGLLQTITQDLPKNLQDLNNIQGLSSYSVKKYGAQLLVLIEKHQQAPESAAYTAIQPLPRETGTILKQLKGIVESAAEKLNIAPEMLARKKDLQVLLQTVLDGIDEKSPKQLTFLQGWRQPIIADSLIQAAQLFKQKDNDTN